MLIIAKSLVADVEIDRAYASGLIFIYPLCGWGAWTGGGWYGAGFACFGGW